MQTPVLLSRRRLVSFSGKALKRDTRRGRPERAMEMMLQHDDNSEAGGGNGFRRFLSCRSRRVTGHRCVAGWESVCPSLDHWVPRMPVTREPTSDSDPDL
jgi:hypothetical protein